MYADLDFRALRPMEELLHTQRPTAYLAAISTDVEWDNNLPNAWLASTPGHPFWLFCAAQIMKAAVLLDCRDEDCLK